MSSAPELGVDGANADQIAYWNSENGEKWVRFQEEIDSIAINVKTRLIERSDPREGEGVIDIGCGTGDTTMAFGARIGPRGQATGIDISSLLLDLAKGRTAAAGLENVRYLLADAQTHPFTAGSADLVVSRFGVMFFSDPKAAFKNIARALRPGGRISFVTWAALDRNPWFSIPRQAAIARLGQVPPTDPLAPGPLAFQDRDRVAGILSSAGLTDIVADVETVPLPFYKSLHQTAALASNVGPAVRIVRELGGNAEDVTAIAEAVEREFERFAAGDAPAVPATLNFYSAVKK